MLTLEAARAFVNNFGLVLFAPRPLGAPAPSLVEATLGAEKASTSPADTAVARGLVSRLVAEGSALPLNLLGGPGDLPDFVVSTATFPFVFTLRGDKGWKRPPETSGAVKVTPLALAVYELLAEKGAMTVAEMVPEVGREVTDTAISRALNELWSLLRVMPALQAGEGETIWELTTTRFSKAVKAGANAGQPTALSALVSLYLAQSYVASEEEIASFLSPLTARSRVREVIHGLVAGRQLNEAVIDGKAVLYIPDALPDFAAMTAEPEDDAVSHEGVEPDVELEEGVDEPTDASADFDKEIVEGSPEADSEVNSGTEPSRIKRFAASSAAPLRGKPLRGKPLAREGGTRTGPRPATPRGPRTEGDRPASTGGYKSAGDRSSDRPRPSRPPSDRPYSPRPKRSFDGDGSPRRPTGDRAASDRPSFAKPWDEERASRPPREGSDSRPPRREAGGDRPFRPARPRDDGRPPFRREAGSDRPSFPRRDDGSGDRPAPRRPFSPGRSSDRAPGGDRPSFGDRAPRGDRPSFGDRAPRGDRPSFGDRPRSPRPPSDRPYTPRPFVKREGGSDSRPPRRDSGDRPSFGDRAPRGDRPSFGDRPRSPRPPSDRPYTPRPFVKREGGAEGRPPRREGGDRPSFGDRAPRGDRPSFGDRAPRGDRPSFGDRPRPGSGPRREGGPGGAPGGRPPFRAGGGSDRRGPGAGGGRPPRPSGGPNGFSRGPRRDAPGRPASARPASDRPTPRRKPEDEA